jgi:hypothetical protein
MTMRKSYRLTDKEQSQFNKLPKLQGAAIEFWGDVAYARGLDYTTIMTAGGDPYEFTALPLGHGKWWCHPMKLKCSKRAASVEI